MLFLKRRLNWKSVIVAIALLVYFSVSVVHDGGFELFDANLDFSAEQESKCKEYFKRLYENDPEWNNQKLFRSDHSDESVSKMKQLFNNLDMYFNCTPIESEFNRLRTRSLPFINPNYTEKKIKYKGKGIALTFPEKELNMAKHTIRVIREFSDIPIEIIHRGDLDDNINLGKNVKIVNVQKHLNPDYQISGYVNKWLAVLFSSFEDLILIDADTVFFTDPEELFKRSEGKTLLFQDRRLTTASVSNECHLEFMKLAGFIPPKKQKFVFKDEDIFGRLFQGHERHLIDSALVVTNKKKYIASLTLGFLLNQIDNDRKCFHGDKEFFWFGHLFLGKDIKLHPQKATLLGKIEKDKFDVCGTQVAHMDGEQILFVNGGLQVCKFDKNNEPETDPLLLNNIIEPSHILIPEGLDSNWISGQSCGGRSYCIRLRGSKRIEIKGKLKEVLKRVVEAWQDTTI